MSEATKGNATMNCVRDAFSDFHYTALYCLPGRYAPVLVMRCAASLANAARSCGCQWLAARLAWYAYDVADHTMSGKEFRLLPQMMPWAYSQDEGRFMP
jgi:hypothetical protein